MRPLIIDDHFKEQIATLLKYAEDHPQTIDDQLDIHNKEKLPVGDNANYSITTTFGYHIVFSIDEAPDNKRVRHLSISVGGDRNDKLPSIVATGQIMKLLGFTSVVGDEIFEGDVWFESISEVQQAVNITQLIN